MYYFDYLSCAHTLEKNLKIRKIKKKYRSSQNRQLFLSSMKVTSNTNVCSRITGTET